MQSYAAHPVSAKVESRRSPVKTLSGTCRLADTPKNVYFCITMRIVLRIVYWLAAIIILATILMSLDYTLAQSILISLIFCPCAIALEYLMPKARKPMDKVYLLLAVMVATVLLIVILHHYVWRTITQTGSIRSERDISPMLINPAFLGLILTASAIGDYFWTKWINKRFKAKDPTITFFSERKSVTLRLVDIAYIESNDTEVRIVTVSAESYRNITGISQWEKLLGDEFLRIHRSYLVNTAHATLIAPDTVTVADARLPVSRKYKEWVCAVLQTESREA